MAIGHKFSINKVTNFFCIANHRHALTMPPSSRKPKQDSRDPVVVGGVGREKKGDYLEKGLVRISDLHKARCLNNFVVAKVAAAAFRRAG